MFWVKHTFWVKPSAVAVALLVASLPAQAVPLNFSLTGDYSANWILDSNPTPSSLLPFGFEIDNVAGIYAGVPGTAHDIRFFTSVDGGGLILNLTANSQNAIAGGPQVFSGTIANPTFLTGTFPFTDQNNGAGGFRLTISAPTQAAPEPQSWIVMLSGLLLLAGVARYRRSL